MIANGLRVVIRPIVSALTACLLFIAIGGTASRAATVAEFVANPAQVMAQYPNGGAELIQLVRDAATTTPSALAAIAGLMSSGNRDQQSAVGAGLGQAYKIVIGTDQIYAAQIAGAVAASTSEYAKIAYAGATGDVATLSTGGGAGGGGGPGGGSGGTAGGSGSGPPSGGSNAGTGTTGQSSTPNTGGTFTGGGGGTGSLSSSAEVVSGR